MKNEKINNLKNLQEKERVAEEELNTKFISLLTHDLRGPFGTVQGLLSLVKMYLKKGKLDELDQLIDLAHQSASQALTLLDNLTVWAVEQNGGLKFRPILVDIKKLLIDEIKYIEAAAKLKNIMIIDDIKLEKQILADNEMLKTVVRNLINNALKFSFPKGKIVVSLYHRDTFIEVSIKDTGKGISLKGQKELFNRKDSKATSGTAKEIGTGRGLLMCKEFIDLHGGEILVESKLGKGSDFRFTLPHMPYYALKTAQA